MNIEQLLNRIAAGVFTILALTTVFGRKNSPAVFDSIGSATAEVASATLGKGVTL